MKYNSQNAPMVCMLKNGACYRGTSEMKPKGVLWHSTGANNPTLKRYVQPADDDPRRIELMDALGTNTYRNDYNHGNTGRQMGVNAWIGQLANGEVTTIQTMPWTYRPWGCGSGPKGSCNSAWIQFEICEDGLNDPKYAMEAYREACELTAYLCKMFKIDPHASVKFNGVMVPTILCHADSHRLGLGNNHGDVLHWFPHFGKTMEDVRDDVAALMAGADDIEFVVPSVVVEEEHHVLGSRLIKKGVKGDDVAELQDALVSLGFGLGKYGTDKNGIDGNCGNATVDAIMAFQTKYGLEPDGIFGPKSLAELKKQMGLTDDGIFGPASFMVLEQALELRDRNIAEQSAKESSENETKNDEVNTTAALEHFKIIVTGNYVNIRKAPDTTQNNIIRTVRGNTVLEVVSIDKATGWFKLADGGFISNKYTKKK